MVNFILELIDFNEGVDYSIVTKIVLLYLVLLWVFVSIWVFNDAKYRFNSIWVAVVLALLNLLLSFPFLLIYLLIRPSHREDWDDVVDGGINIPVANFTGKEGVVISLQLKIDSKKMLDEKIDYNLDIVLNNDQIDNSLVKVNNSSIQDISNESSIAEEETNKIKNIITKIRSKSTNLSSSIKDRLGEGRYQENNNEETFSTESDKEIREKTKPKKKNKKSKKKKNK